MFMVLPANLESVKSKKHVFLHPFLEYSLPYKVKSSGNIIFMLSAVAISSDKSSLLAQSPAKESEFKTISMFSPLAKQTAPFKICMGKVAEIIITQIKLEINLLTIFFELIFDKCDI